MRIAKAVNLYQERDSGSNELGAQNVRGAESQILRDESDRWTCVSLRTSVEGRDESLDPRFLNFTGGLWKGQAPNGPTTATSHVTGNWAQPWLRDRQARQG
jgi:hypothetical protein